MPDLKFEIISADVKLYAVVPTLSFNLEITNAVENEEVYAAALRCQVIIEAIKRRYNKSATDDLLELFGEPSRWDETLGSLLWTFVSVPVPRFTGKTKIEITIPCSEDQAMAAGKYFHAVKEGEIPLAFLFSGTLFYGGTDGNLQVTQVSWEKEAFYKMPAVLWQQMMDTYFPNCRWLHVRKDIYDKLVRLKAHSKHPTLEDCLDSLLQQSLNEPQLVEKENT